MKANTKKEAKWTEGEWKAGKAKPDPMNRPGEEYGRSRVYAPSHTLEMRWHHVDLLVAEVGGRTVEEAEANAHLLAASKDMYAALEDAPEPAEWLDSITASHIFFEKWFIDYRKWYSTHRRPALAKAEGRE